MQIASHLIVGADVWLSMRNPCKGKPSISPDRGSIFVGAEGFEPSISRTNIQILKNHTLITRDQDLESSAIRLTSCLVTIYLIDRKNTNMEPNRYIAEYNYLVVIEIGARFIFSIAINLNALKSFGSSILIFFISDIFRLLIFCPFFEKTYSLNVFESNLK